MDTETTVTNRYYIISFRGCPRQHALYSKLKDICEEALSWLVERSGTRSSDEATAKHEAEVIAWWMNGTGGFTRAHMPYYVSLTEREYKILIHAIRRGGTEDRDYGWLRQYGEWESAGARTHSRG